MENDKIIIQLKSQRTLRLLILGIITLGIYVAHYIKRQTKIINQHLDVEKQIQEGIPNFILILSYLSVISIIPLAIFRGADEIALVSDIMDIAGSILVLIWAFKARNRMNTLLASIKGTMQWFHGFWTFLFQALYFNFKINQLNENFAKSSIAH